MIDFSVTDNISVWLGELGKIYWYDKNIEIGYRGVKVGHVFSFAWTCEFLDQHWNGKVIYWFHEIVT